MSSATPVVHAFAELGVPHERVTFDLAAGEQREPEFLAINPNGKVPTLVVDGTPIFETLAILQWLGDRYGVERGLWPKFDDPDRLTALAWTSWAYVTFGACLNRFLQAGSERSPRELHHPPQRERAREEADELLAVLDGRLDGRDYLLGETFSLADLVVASVITYATFCDVKVDGHRHVVAWLARFQAREAYRAAWASAAA
jgi:GST-like protein